MIPTKKPLKRIIGILILVTSIILMIQYLKFPTPFVILDNPIIKQSYYLSFLITLFILGLVLTASKSERLEEKLQDVQTFETAKGSKYDVLPDGRIQRYKTATRDLRPPHNATVFIPDFETLRKAIPAQEFRTDLFGTDSTKYERKLEQLFYMDDYKFHIIDKNGKILENQKAISQAGREIYLTVEKNGNVDTYIPVAPVPRKGYFVYQTTKENKDRRTHIGHQVTNIKYKDRKLTS